jgi:hypothetical protein
MPHKLMVPGLRYPEPTLQQEIGSLGDDDLMEFMNLIASETGVEGTIFVSTSMGWTWTSREVFREARRWTAELFSFDFERGGITLK